MWIIEVQNLALTYRNIPTNRIMFMGQAQILVITPNKIHLATHS